MEPKRRLSAVWFADIVGYTTLSSRNEPAAIRLVEALQGLTREILEVYEGRIVKFIGDAVLAEFSSTDSAVRAAVALQERYVAAASALGEDSKLRIGVHLGEVTATPDGDLYGDGINTAARLHHEAQPGRVIISEDVWRQLRQRPEFKFASLGAVELRGITTRVAVYDVLFGAQAALAVTSLPLATTPRRWPRRFTVAAAVAAATVLVAAGVAVVLLNQPAGPAPPPEAVQPETQAPVQPEVSTPVQPKAQTPAQAPAAARTAAPPPAPARSDTSEEPKPEPASPTPAVTPPARAEAAAIESPEDIKLREMRAVRQLLERLVSAINSDRAAENIAALGPGAIPLSEGVASLKKTFGEGFQVRLGRIIPVSTLEKAVEVRFFLLASSRSRSQMPLVFAAVISRDGDRMQFASLRREPPAGRGRAGRGGQ